MTTTAIYFTVLEAGFALCAVCLPALAGIYKVERVKNFLNRLSPLLPAKRAERERPRERLDLTKDEPKAYIAGVLITPGNVANGSPGLENIGFQDNYNS